MIATVMELLGAMTLGSYNASTIRGGIINTVSKLDRKRNELGGSTSEDSLKIRVIRSSSSIRRFGVIKIFGIGLHGYF